jgi:hypothetical protein
MVLSRRVPVLVGEGDIYSEEYGKRIEYAPTDSAGVGKVRKGKGTLIVFRLWLCIWPIKKERYNFLEYFFPNIHRTMYAVARLHPIHFANRDLPRDSFATVAELDVHHIPAQDYRDAMKGIVMPGRGLSWLEPEPANQIISAMMQYLLLSFCRHDRGIMPQSGKTSSYWLLITHAGDCRHGNYSAPRVV